MWRSIKSVLIDLEKFAVFNPFKYPADPEMLKEIAHRGKYIRGRNLALV